MNINQPPAEELSEYNAIYYSAMGSIHPTGTRESSEAYVGGNRGVSEAIPEWLAQLVAKASNPQRVLE